MKQSLCQKIAVLFLTVAALSAPAQITNRIGGLGPPARQVIVANGAFDVFPGTNNQAQALFDWMDDYWPRFTNGAYATIPTQVSNLQTLVNWLDTNMVGRSMTNVFYPSSNPSNYLDSLGTINVGNTNWVRITNATTVADVTNQIAFAARRFVGASAYAYNYSISAPTGKSLLTAGMLSSSGGGIAGFYSALGVGTASNSYVVDQTNYQSNARIKFGKAGYYRVSTTVGVTASPTTLDKAVAIAMVDVTSTNFGIVLTPWANEQNAYLHASTVVNIGSATNVYALQLNNTYVSTSTVEVISVGFSAEYLGD